LLIDGDEDLHQHIATACAYACHAASQVVIMRDAGA
jgi:hypothetical protein